MNRVLTGLDRIREGSWKILEGQRLGLLANQASLDSNMTAARDVIAGLLPGKMKALFGPQHGYGGEDQDNMIETGHSTDPVLNIPVYSLYSEDRTPQKHMMDGIDALVVDLQDVGTRVYTFASTLLNCMKAASRDGKNIVILDRPNPLGGDIVEGNLLKPEHFSFVGPCSIPMRHGLTMGELGRLLKSVFQLECELNIITMEGWKRSMLWHQTGLRWLMPSPNMPFPDTAFVYPGQVIWEGTNLSEGRGTCRPFEIFGAPFVEPEEIRSSVDQRAMEGCSLQEYTFRPTFQKWAGELCRGFMIHVADPVRYRPYLASIALLKAVMENNNEYFEWADPPYEYEYKKRPIELILGDSSLLDDLQRNTSLAHIEEKWGEDLKEYMSFREPFLLYG
ncbi:exo-beta-N-acetylmuramidase NamZ domain-containing protein [Thermodesulfobacteriota bacterium]